MPLSTPELESKPLIHLAHILSMLVVMLAVAHPDPRFQAWGERWMDNFWKKEFIGVPGIGETPGPGK